MKKLLTLFFIAFPLIFVLSGCFFSPEDIVFSDVKFTYDGSEKSLTSPTEIPDKYELRYENNSATDVGQYLCKVSVWNTKKDCCEYETFAVMEILPAKYDMSQVAFNDTTVSYNGQAQELKITSPLPDGVTVSYSENSFTDAGEYEVVANFSGDEKNYLPIDDMKATLTILPIEAPVTVKLKNTFLHSSSTPSFSSSVEGEVIFQEGQRLTPGTNTYYCDFIPKSSNYTKKEDIPVSLTVSATVKYYNGNEVIKTEYVGYNKTISADKVEQYEEGDFLYTFSHWEDSNGKKFATNQKITDDISLYAVFEKEEKLFVNLVYNNTKTEKFGFYASNLPLSLPSPDNFLGWHKDNFYSSKSYYSINSISVKNSTLYALYVPDVKLSDTERTDKPKYDTTTVSVSKDELYRGSLIEVNEILSSHITETDLKNLYGNTKNVAFASSSMFVSDEAKLALELLCADYIEAYPTEKLLVSLAYSDACYDTLSGNSVKLRNEKVSSPEGVATAKAFLAANAKNYGFVRRYLPEYSKSTGESGDGYESLYRYVGIPHSIFMENHKLSLEEYLCYLKQFTDTHLFIKCDDKEYEIFYAPSAGAATEIRIPRDELYTISGNNNDGFIVTVEREAAKRDLDILICIDAGHGGEDGGASGGESVINLSVAKLAQQECERQGFTVLMTRDDDYFVTLGNRCRIANSAEAEIFVSIHCNSATSTDANGTEVFYYKGTNSKKLANAVYENMTELVPTRKRGVKIGNHQVTRETEMPAILCELAFLSNADDYAKLHDKGCQASWAEAICRGICEYYNIDYIE